MDQKRFAMIKRIILDAMELNGITMTEGLVIMTAMLITGLVVQKTSQEDFEKIMKYLREHFEKISNEK